MTDRLLVVDDSPDFTALVVVAAKAEGYEALEITDSTKFETALRSWSPTHLMIDLNMPTIDGIEALQILARQRSAAKIVICSGAADEFLDAANRLGGRLGLVMSGIIRKPIRLKELKTFLNGVAGRNESASSSGQAFDRNVFDEVCSTMGREWVMKGLNNLATQIETTFAEVNLASPDREQLGLGAHALASYAWILGFSRLSHHCRELEDACNKNGDLSSPLHQAQDASRSACTKVREMITHLTEHPAH
jgi:DNA-binding response OmpR family regulator